MEKTIKLSMGSVTITDDCRIIFNKKLGKRQEFLLKDLIKVSTVEASPNANGLINFIFTNGNVAMNYSVLNKKRADLLVEELNERIKDNPVPNNIEFEYRKTVIDYQGGHPKLPNAKSMIVTVTNKRLILAKDISIDFSNINSINYDTLEQLEKRVTATRLLTLGIFAFAFKKKKKNIQKYLAIEFNDDAGIQQMVAFGGPEAAYLYQTVYDAYYEYKKNSKVETSTTSTSDSYEELKKLKELLDMGIITQEEFDIKKKQLLRL